MMGSVANRGAPAIWINVIILSFVVISLATVTEGLPEPVEGLSYGYYSSSCPKAEHIVREEMECFLKSNISSVGGFLRIAFHDCFVQGCDASVLVNATDGELIALPNQTLRREALALIDKIKEKLEAVCPNTVSCADIVILAGRDSVHLANGPYISVPTGRRDSLDYVLGSAVLQSLSVGPTSNITQLLQFFKDKGLSPMDLAALSGTHTVGTAHCSSFNNSLFPLANRLPRSYSQSLLQICPNPESDNLAYNDMTTPFVFDNSYFVNALNGQVLFDSDNALVRDSETLKAVQDFASKQQEFFDQFAESYIKMSMMNVKTGAQGNIRKRCSILNSQSTNKNITGSVNMMYAATDTIYNMHK